MPLFNPENYDSSTGLWPNDDVAKVVGAAIMLYDYNGKRANKVPVIELTLGGRVEDGKEMPPVKQYWGLGKAEDWAPTPDGKGVIAIGKRKGLHASTNAAMLFNSLLTAGMPIDMINGADSDITALVGLKARFIRSKITREGLKDDAGKDKDFEVVLVTEIVTLPGEEGEGGGGAATEVKAGIQLKATAAVLKFIAETKSGKVKKADLPSKVFADPELLADTDRNEIVNLMVADDTFLTAGPWKFEGGVLSAK